MKRKSKTFSLRHFSWRVCIIVFKSWQTVSNKTWTLCYLVFNLFGIRRTSSKTLKFIGLYSFFFFCFSAPPFPVYEFLVGSLSKHDSFSLKCLLLYFAHSLSLTLNIVSNLSSADAFTMVSHMCLFLTSYVYLHLITTNVIWIYSLASFAFTIFCFTLLVIKILSFLIKY